MALNSSGKISLAGAVTGESVALELSKSATGMISMNDTDVRTLAGVSFGLISLDNLHGKSSASYWIGYFSGLPTSGASLCSPPSFDSSGNIFTSLYGTAQANNCILKLSPQGAFLNACTLDISWNQLNGPVLIGSTDHAYIMGNKSSGTYSRCAIVKLTNDLSTYVTQFGFNYGSGSPAANTQQITVAKYYQGRNTFNKVIGWGDRPRLQIFDNNLTPLYTCSPTGSATSRAYCGAVDGLGNWYVGEYLTNVSYFGKFNTSNSNVWCKRIDGISEAKFCAASATGKFAITGESDGGVYSFVMVLDENGNVLWTRQLTTSNTAFPSTVSFDSNNNVYVHCHMSSLNDSYLYKFDINGNLIWQRNWNTSSGQVKLQGLTIGPDDAMYANCGYQVFAKLPNDGSGMGVYTINGQTITYSVGTQSVSSVTKTVSSSSTGTFDAKTLYSWTFVHQPISGSFTPTNI